MLRASMEGLTNSEARRMLLTFAAYKKAGREGYDAAQKILKDQKLDGSLEIDKFLDQVSGTLPPTNQSPTSA